jgi:hypothetical protein
MSNNVITFPSRDHDQDPIFEAIACCRTAKRQLDAAYASRKSEACTADLARTLWSTYDDFAVTVPTTMAGLAAMLIFAEKICEWGDQDILGEEPVIIMSSFAKAAKTLLGGKHERD